MVGKGPKPPYFDAFSVCQALGHDLNQSMNCQVNVAAGELLQLVRHAFDQFRFVHSAAAKGNQCLYYKI